MIERPIDLPSLDARIARAYGRVERELSRLAAAPSAAGGREPSGDAKVFGIDFAGIRDVAGQSTFSGLGELSPGASDAPHRDALLRWVHELLQLRTAWDLVVDEADALHAPDPTMSRRAANAIATEKATGATPAHGSIPTSFDEALQSFIEAPHVVAATLSFGRLADLADPIAAVRKELRARRFEVSTRLGLSHPWALATSEPTTKLSELAARILDMTEPLSIELHRELRRRSSGARGSAAASSDAPLAIYDAAARDAREGWPAHLGGRWFEETFRALAPRPPQTVRMPRALGGASFLRAADAWGGALRLVGIPRTFPFALARDPYPTEARMFGGAIAIAIADRVFARRKLGLSAGSADAHARTLGRSLFMAIRTLAATLSTGMDAAPDPDHIEALSARVFGSPLPTTLGGAWSYGGFAGTSRVDLPARLLGAIHAHGLVQQLVQRFDEDWFDNPRAGAHLASIGAGPVWRGDVPDASAVTAIARMFEQTLG
jgi:hypothetical protein